jgi:hypothetical protein
VEIRARAANGEMVGLFTAEDSIEDFQLQAVDDARHN